MVSTPPRAWPSMILTIRMKPSVICFPFKRNHCLYFAAGGWKFASEALMKGLSGVPANPRGKNLSDLIDELDARILELIQEDASVSVADLAERVGLSPSPCWRRIKRLEDLGVIKRRVTVLDPDKLGLGFEVYAAVKLSLPSRANLEAFEARLDAWPE